MTAEKVLDSSTLDAVDNTLKTAEKAGKAAAETTADILSETMDVIDETLDTMERIPKADLNGTTKKQQIIILVTVGVISAGVGAAVSHYVTKRVLTTKFEKLLEEENDKAREHYAKLNKIDLETGEPLTPEELVGERTPSSTTAEEIVEARGYRTTADAGPRDEISDQQQHAETMESLRRGQDDSEAPSEPVPVETRNVFRDARSANSEFDYGEEIPHRTPDKPYIITQDEFDENEHEFENLALSYFDEDDILVNERDQIVNDSDQLVGDQNLMSFGKGSKDKNTVHIRNERLGLDMEVVRTNGSWAKALGVDTTHLQHSDEPRIKKMRPERD